MITLTLLIGTVCALVALDLWLPRRAFGRKKGPILVDFESLDDHPDPVILATADDFTSVQGLVHYTRFHLSPPTPAGRRGGSRIPSELSLGPCTQKRQSAPHSFSFHSSARRRAFQRFGLRRHWQTD